MPEPDEDDTQEIEFQHWAERAHNNLEARTDPSQWGAWAPPDAKGKS